MIIEQGQDLPEGFRVSAGGDINISDWYHTDPILVPGSGNIKLRNIHYNKRTYLKYLKFDIGGTSDVQLNITQKAEVTTTTLIATVRKWIICTKASNHEDIC